MQSRALYPVTQRASEQRSVKIKQRAALESGVMRIAARSQVIAGSVVVLFDLSVGFFYAALIENIKSAYYADT